MAELYQLQEQEIPEAMGQLQDSHANLKKVADYCEGLYLQAADAEKKPALEETRGYTTQALASVAYQINTLATSFLSLLDLQARQLVDMESNISHLSQTVAIHKEKVARREIGVLTTNKSFFRPVGVKTPGIIFPEQPEKPVKYIRKPIDYTMLDSVGSGGPKTQITAHRTSHRTGSVSSTSSSSQGNVPRFNSNPSSNAGTLTRGGRGVYAQGPARQSTGPIAPPVAPPTVPSHYMAGPLTNPTYGHLQAPPAPPPAPPMNHSAAVNGRLDTSPYQTTGQPLYNGGMMAPPPPLSPPLPPMPNTDRYSMDQDMPPPPPEDSPDPPAMPSSSFPEYPNNIDLEGYDDSINRQNSVPIPPPSPLISDEMDMHQRGIDPQWAPEDYMEKVVAIFDYEPQNEDELRFRENTVLYVIKKNSDGWWEGVMESNEGLPIRGLFPENYVESLL